MKWPVGYSILTNYVTDLDIKNILVFGLRRNTLEMAVIAFINTALTLASNLSNS